MMTEEEKKLNPACKMCDNYKGNDPKSECNGDHKNSFYYPNDCPGFFSQAVAEAEADAERELIEQAMEEYERDFDEYYDYDYGDDLY